MALTSSDVISSAPVDNRQPSPTTVKVLAVGKLTGSNIYTVTAGARSWIALLADRLWTSSEGERISTLATSGINHLVAYPSSCRFGNPFDYRHDNPFVCHCHSASSNQMSRMP